MERFQRTIKLIGNDSFQKLNSARIIVLGVGGVGSFAVEALVRSGVGEIVLIDKDVYEESNINRQWPSNTGAIGRAKVEVIAEECLRIAPSVNVFTEKICLMTSNINDVLAKYLMKDVIVIEAIDDLKTKVYLLEYLKMNNVKFISSMGAANVTDIDSIRYGELAKTTHCPVAKIIRKELGLKGIKQGIPVVFSSQERTPGLLEKGSIMPITASFGLRLAMWAIKSIA